MSRVIRLKVTGSEFAHAFQPFISTVHRQHRRQQNFTQTIRAHIMHLSCLLC